MNKPIIKTLSSGYTLIRFSPECFAQIPPGWTGESIADEYIFHPNWNQERINDWWKEKEK